MAKRESGSDLGDFGVRKYEAETGRFLSVDPLWEEQRPWDIYHYMEGSTSHAKRAVITHPNTNSPKTASVNATTNKEDNHINQY